MPPAAPTIRTATHKDAAAINRIYNHYVRHSVITFDLEPWDIARREEWLDGFSGNGGGDGSGGDGGNGDANGGGSGDGGDGGGGGDNGDNGGNGDANGGGDGGDGDNGGGDDADAAGDNADHALVAELNGNIIGFAYNQQFRARAAYRRSTETTIYTAPDSPPAGTGSRLYTALFARLATTNLHRAYAIIALPNPRSVAFHQRFGFRQVGVLSEVGYKFGGYVDVAWFEKPL